MGKKPAVLQWGNNFGVRGVRTLSKQKHPWDALRGDWKAKR
jgi:hypothetical protein